MTRKPTGHEAIDALLAQAGHPAAPKSESSDSPATRPAAPQTPPQPDEDLADIGAIVADCAGLDHSDTSNGQRLIRHFGRDLAVVRQRGGRAPLYAAWQGGHWDTETGNMGAHAIAQKLGDLIKLEADHIGPTPDEQKALDAGAKFIGRHASKLDGEELALRDAAADARDALDARKAARAKFGASSKNAARLAAMMTCAAPHILRDPDEFNRDLYAIATPGHTIRFRPEPGGGWRLDVAAGHDRADLISTPVPTPWSADASAHKWQAMLCQVQPEAAMRRLLQQAFGLGLLGVTVQRLFFHIGTGANGKSVVMEVICRVLGGLAVTLPAESFFGDARKSGGPSPDIARLFGKRLLRVKELPAGEQFREAQLKELTGGETVTARSLFEGYFDFKPLFTAHMSGNEEPNIRGVDDGIWRRMTVVPWPVTIPVEQRREFEPFVAELMEEAPGILNWLIDGALDYLENGLAIPDEVTARTAEYREDMDPLGGFVETCILVTGVQSDSVGSAELYRVYEDWCAQDGAQPRSQKAFSNNIAQRARTMGFSKAKTATGKRWIGIVIVNPPPRRASTGAHDYEGHSR